MNIFDVFKNGETEVGAMIGTRTLKIDLPVGERDLKILIETPEGSQTNWTCAFEIDWPEAARRRVARGIDALQAAISRSR